MALIGYASCFFHEVDNKCDGFVQILSAKEANMTLIGYPSCIFFMELFIYTVNWLKKTVRIRGSYGLHRVSLMIFKLS